MALDAQVMKVQERAILLCLVVVVVTSSALDANPLYGFGCMKQCSAIFSNCYKTCNVPFYESGSVKRDAACLDMCIVKLTLCNHYCAK